MRSKVHSRKDVIRNGSTSVRISPRSIPIFTNAAAPSGSSVRHKMRDALLQVEVRAVIAQQDDAIRNAVFLQELRRQRQPVAHHRKEARILDLGGDVEIRRQRAQRGFVGLEEQPILAAEMLEDRTFGNAQLVCHVTHASGFVAVVGEVTHRGIENQRALLLRPFHCHRPSCSAIDPDEYSDIETPNTQRLERNQAVELTKPQLQCAYPPERIRLTHTFVLARMINQLSRQGEILRRKIAIGDADCSAHRLACQPHSATQKS